MKTVNTQYFFYAIEVEKAGSITQAASNLFMSQPTLSKAIRDMEASMGFPVFKRTSKGVVPTQRGQEFLAYAKKIAAQLQKMDAALQARDTTHQLFSLAISRVGYIAQATAEFLCSFDNQRDMEIDILETSSMRVIDSVAHGHYVLGVIRYHVEDEDFFRRSLAQAGLQCEQLWQSGYMALMGRDHPLASQDSLTAEELAPYIEIAYGDEEVPYIRTSEAEGPSEAHRGTKRILVYDRGSCLDLLRTNPYAYARSSALPEDMLERNGLVQRKCRNGGQFKDLIVSKQGYRFSKLDRALIDRLCLERNKAAFRD